MCSLQEIVHVLQQGKNRGVGGAALVHGRYHGEIVRKASPAATKGCQDGRRTANDSRAKDPIALPMGCEEDKDKERKWRHLGDRGQNDHDRESRYPLLQQEPESDP